MTISLKLPLATRIRWKISAAWNRSLDFLCAPVLNHLTDDEYFGSRTRRQAIAKFARRGAWFGNRRAHAACAARLKADNDAADAAYRASQAAEG